MKRVKIVLLAFSIAFLTNCKSNRNESAQKHWENITVKGNRFVAGTEPINFKGLCLEDIGELMNNGHWNKNYIDQASKWNVNVVRFPVHPKHWNRLGKEKYLEELKKGVEWAKERNMYCIIDWHVIGNMKDEKWQNPMYETTLIESLDFWATIAKTFKDEPAVAFYELYNEPTVFNGTLGEMNWQELTTIYQQILDTIKTYDKNTTALLAGFNWAYDLKELNTYDPKIENVGYITHPYPQKSEQPWPAKWDEYFGFVTDKYPVFATEFGFAYPNQVGAHIPVMGDETYGEEILNYFNSHNISYTLWVFSWHWYPTLLKDSTFAIQEGQGEFFYKKFTETK
ncbi:MAG: cellulase family glycosylhydrolase [Salinivirgaceae bacterium]